MISIGIFIYVLGFSVSYGFCKYARDQMKHRDGNTWGYVLASSLASLFSWITVIQFFYGMIKSNKKFPINIKPPKWL